MNDDIYTYVPREHSPDINWNTGKVIIWEGER